MTVVRCNHGWIVVNGTETLAGPFPTMAAAWRWIDRQAGDPINPAEKKADWIAFTRLN